MKAIFPIYGEWPFSIMRKYNALRFKIDQNRV